MINKRQFFLFVLLSIFLSTGVIHGRSPVIFKSGKAEIYLKDYLRHNLYWWPTTLLNFPVVFQEDVSPEALIVKDKATGRQIPFQLSDFQKKSDGRSEATLYLMTDIPSGGERAFVLQKGVPESFGSLSISESGQQVTVQTDKLEVQLPASLTASPDRAYSWTEYQSRSVMLVGSDYFITYDDMYNNNIGSHFSWFTHLMEDLPEIQVVKCGGQGFDFFRFNIEKTEHTGRETKGVWYDGLGDIMTFVSHRKDFKPESAPSYGCITAGPNSKDYIFRNDTPVNEDSVRVFSGTAVALRIWPEAKEKKGFVRVTALNDEHAGEASVVYPVYFTNEKPHFPDGLKLLESENGVILNWGQELGCSEYRLYRRVKGESKYQPVYKGSAQTYNDKSIRKNVIFEYVVAAIDGNGESACCHPIDNDPDSWLNFNPVPGEPFRRVGSRFRGTDNMGNKVEMYYPE